MALGRKTGIKLASEEIEQKVIHSLYIELRF